jgi:3-deoxy-D-manno-octulosonic acid kinase
MKSSEKHFEQNHILYDAELLWEVSTDIFSVEELKKRNAITGQARGRGTTYFLEINQNHYVLRHYLRGGMVAKLMGDQYIWTGLTNTRAWQEWRLLEKMTDMGLPVPKPVAARVCRSGLFYTADILMVRIMDTRSLAQQLEVSPLEDEIWESIGQCIRRFHDADIYHADLNAHNILLDHGNRIYLTDFDKGRLRHQAESWREQNLSRLHRSLQKLKNLCNPFYFSEQDWDLLCMGYG